jgi:zinc transport system substrate-binding protein
VEFENGLVPKVKNLYPKLRLVDTTEGVEFRDLEAHSHEDEHGHDEGEHEEHGDDPEGGRDPHIWLGRDAAKSQAGYVRDVLAGIDPSGAAQYARNHDALVRDIDSMFDSLVQSLAPLKGKPVFVYHPAFGYFLDEFGIEQEAVEVGGKEPTQKTLAELIERAREHGAKVIFVQPQFSKSAAKTVADAIGGSVVEINSLDADWLANLKRMGDALKAAAR